ncbi:hypothetical protein [Citricoccus muralis]|uniref:Uncharacterized protein n=1 Tax=Citricoccus muralis TaxID=169134 RepID=A0ABY8H6Y9_9MICC|nr:hypothetical protein [Citricoccus muralis]WFP16450.1 hypothetical protein P8192_13890 [Citricoccus muralis]
MTPVSECLDQACEISSTSFDIMMTVGRFLMTLSAGLFAAYVVFFGGALLLFALRDRLSPKTVTTGRDGDSPASPSKGPVTVSAPVLEGRSAAPAFARTSAAKHSYGSPSRTFQPSSAQGGASL